VAHAMLCDMTSFNLIGSTNVSHKLSTSIFKEYMYLYSYTLKMDAEISHYSSTLKEKRADFYVPHYTAASHLRRP
jgi:hypothetical protein